MPFTFYESDCLDVDDVMTGLTDAMLISVYGFYGFRNSAVLPASTENLLALTKSNLFSAYGFSIFRSSELKRLRLSMRG